MSTATASQPVPASAPASPRAGELAEVMRAYNQVTENLQRSHEALLQRVERLQAELASTNSQLQRSRRLAALGEMAAGIAHEIRNPLAAIHLYAGMIAQDVEQAGRPAETESSRNAALGSAASSAGKIASAVRGLNAIVNDVLAFARDVSPRIMPTPVGILFDRTVESHRPAIEAAGVRVERPGDDSLVVPVDAELIQQAMLNLVRNAVDAMSEAVSDVAGVLTLSARRANADRVELVVRDTGPGIPDAAIDRIFNPFFTTRSTGTGLGLAIVHRIVDAHGGTIAVHNDRGAVFVVDLPLVPSPSGAGAVSGRNRGAVE